MNWTVLETEEQLAAIIGQSYNRPQVIFKHSTRCSVSSVVKTRLERSAIPSHIDFHYLDLIRYRNVSNKIAEGFNVWHESPQVLLIKDGECIFDESHLAIFVEDIVAEAPAVNSQ